MAGTPSASDRAEVAAGKGTAADRREVAQWRKRKRARKGASGRRRKR